MGEHREPGILHRILRRLGISKDELRSSPHHSVVLAEQLAMNRRIAICQSAHEPCLFAVALAHREGLASWAKSLCNARTGARRRVRARTNCKDDRGESSRVCRTSPKPSRSPPLSLRLETTAVGCLLRAVAAGRHAAPPARVTARVIGEEKSTGRAFAGLHLGKVLRGDEAGQRLPDRQEKRVRLTPAAHGLEL